jgi:hypothetical protein
MKQLSILVTCALLSLAPRSSDAREASGKLKGWIGGGLMGAEVVLLTESAFQLKSRWAYLGGAVGGAAAGAAGGYFLIEKDHGPRGPIYLFAGSLALVVPTILAVLTASQFEPPATYRQDLPVDEDAPYEPGLESPDTLRLPATDRRMARSPIALDRSATQVEMRLPTFDVRQSFSAEDLAMFGVSQHVELHVSVFNGVF